jgi:oligopeptide/dipeptide ABC transporter ATP-binding protein
MNNNTLLEIKDLKVEFRSGHECVKAVNGISYSVNTGETFAIVGESGSGKTVSTMALMKLLPVPPAFIEATKISFKGNDLLNMTQNEWRHLSGDKIAMIFQDALAALNPVYSVGWQISEMFRIHRQLDSAEIERRTIDLLSRVGIPEPHHRLRDYPHQFSGGMRQRAMIAMAIALKPDLLIADEPTTALDVTIQAQIMGLLKDLRDETGMSLILITHDLGVVAETADRVAIMYAGRIMETGAIKDVLGNPTHPYTWGLLNSRPQTHKRGEPLQPIYGSPPNLAYIPQGCAFHPRCQHADTACRELTPTSIEVSPGHYVACHSIRNNEAMSQDGKKVSTNSYEDQKRDADSSRQ